MDWDIRHSSLANGNGTPWGGKDFQDPGNPNYVTDPNSMPGFDYSGAKKSMEQGLRLQRARTDVNSKQQISHANAYGASSETGKAIGQSGADTESAINAGNAKIDRQAYDEKVTAMNAYNTNLQRQYDIAKGRSDKEDKQRQDWQDKVGNIFTMGLGG